MYGQRWTQHSLAAQWYQRNPGGHPRSIFSCVFYGASNCEFVNETIVPPTVFPVSSSPNTNGEVAMGFDYQFHSLCAPKNENTKVSEFIHISPFGDRIMGFICLNAFCGINQQLLSKCLSIQESLPWVMEDVVWFELVYDRLLWWSVQSKEDLAFLVVLLRFFYWHKAITYQCFLKIFIANHAEQCFRTTCLLLAK